MTYVCDVGIGGLVSILKALSCYKPIGLQALYT